MPSVDNQGVRIAYSVQGDGEPLILIHGWSCEGRYWAEFGYTSDLTRDFKVIVPDLRGHGASETPRNGDFSDHAFASDVTAVLDQLSVDSAHIFGYSLGGWVALELAAVFPERVQGVVVGGSHPYAEDLSPLRSITTRDLLDGWEAARASLSNQARSNIADLDPELLKAMVPDRVDKTARLVGMQSQLLTVCGTNDWRYEDMKRFAMDHEFCSFLAIEGTDHLETWLQSEQILPLVRQLLQAKGE